MMRTGIILAGGKSSRFGSNKAIYDFQGKTMLKHSLDLLKPFCDRILISGDKEEYYRYDYACIPDKYGMIGPLGGILSCLEESETEENIIVTCDMPLVTKDLLAKLILYHKNGLMTIFQDTIGHLYAFPLIIQKRHQPRLKILINNGKFKLQELMADISYNSVLISDKEENLLANINSQDDLLKIEKTTMINDNK